MGKLLLIVFILTFIPYLVMSKAKQLKRERQARVRYFIFIFAVVLLLIAFIKIL